MSMPNSVPWNPERSDIYRRRWISHSKKQEEDENASRSCLTGNNCPAARDTNAGLYLKVSGGGVVPLRLKDRVSQLKPAEGEDEEGMPLIEAQV